MKEGSAEGARVAELQYSRDHNRIELVVPHGTKVSDLPKIFEVLGRGILGRLPRGCLACTSGDHLFIRERLDHVIRIDLERGTAI